MPSFIYVARETGTGREIRSSLEAQTEQAAIAALLNRNLLVVSIQEKVARKGKTSGGSVALVDLVVFTRQLATMIDAGLAMVQSLVVVGIAFWAGARFAGGFSGILLLLLGVVLLTAVFCSLSNAVALLARDQTALIGISQLITLPLMFLSSAIMNTKLSPEWVQNVAAWNPFEWAVIVGRQALSAHPDWASLWGHAGLLAALAVVMAAWATSAFRVYQRSA